MKSEPVSPPSYDYSGKEESPAVKSELFPESPKKSPVKVEMSSPLKRSLSDTSDDDDVPLVSCEKSGYDLCLH